MEALSTVYAVSNATDWCRGPGGGNASVAGRRPVVVDVAAQGRGMPRTGLYLARINKVASSAAAAVSLQIAAAVAADRGRARPCPYHVAHGDAHRRRKKPHFLWTVVRRPDRRAVSRYFFRNLSRMGQEYNATDLLRQLAASRNYMVEYLGAKSGRVERHGGPQERWSWSRLRLLETLAGIFAAYDFVAVTERLDESLVVLQLLLDLPDEAIVVLDSKRAGGLDDGAFKGRCHRILPSFTTPDVDRYVAKDYRAANADYLLHAAAVRSLDRTIDALGRDRVAAAVDRHRRLKTAAEAACRATTAFPCVRDGDPPRARTDCFFEDAGCGHACVAAVVRNLTGRAAGGG